MQRLLKTLNRDDAKAIRIALCLSCVVPIGGNEEDVDMCSTGADRLLLDASDPRHAPVDLHLARRCDPVAVVDVPPTLLEQLEGEGKTGGRPAHVAQVEADRKREA